MAVQYCNYDIKGTLGVVGTATIGGALNVTEYIFRSGQGSNYHRFLASRQIFVVGNATSIDLNNGVSTFGATGGATTLQGTSVTLDASGDITLDADGSDILLSDGGTVFGKFASDSNNLNIFSQQQDKDIVFRGNDGGSGIVALTLDMSAGGNATFAGNVTANNFYGLAQDLAVTSNDTFSGTYSLLWHAGADVYSSTWMTVSGSNDTLTVPTIAADLNGTINTATTGVTQTAGNNSTLIATTAYVDSAVSGAGVGTFLPLAGGTMTGNIVLNDNIQLQVGSSGDLRIYHDGSNSYINEVGTGDLIIKGGNDILFQDAVGNTLANMNQANSVELYWGNSKKFETTTTGIEVSGRAYFNATDANTPSSNDVSVNGYGLLGNRTTNPLYIQNYGDGGVRIATNVALGSAGGMLVTDSLVTVDSGNILLSGTGRIQGIDTVSASTDAANKAYVDAHVSPAGTYLPLAGGTLTGAFYAEGSLPTTSGMSGTGIGLGQASNYAHAQFSGSAGGYIDFSEPNVDWSGRIIYTHSSDSMVFYTATTAVLTLDSSNNATFTGNVLIPSNLQHVNDDNNEISFTTDAQDFRTNNVSRLDISNSGVRFGGGNARVTTILDQNDLGSNSDTALATQQSIKAYVDTQVATIPSGLNFQGNWNASTNSPTLTSGSGTPGFYYNVSVPGSTNLDGETDWQVGDWAVFVEAGATDKWEKIDNTSALTGVGVNGRVTFWNGTNTLASDAGLTYNSSTDILTASGGVLWSGGGSAESNSAYDNMITAFSDSGSSTITLTLTQQDGGTLTTSFSNPQGTVTGTGSDNRLALWNGTTAIDSNENLSISGNDLAIGTQAGTTTARLLLYGTTANNGASVIKTTNGNLHIDSDDTHTVYLNYYTGGTTSVVVGNGASGSSGTAFYASGNATVGSNLDITTISNATSDTDKFLVADGTRVKYRTGAQVLSDIGGAPATGGAYLPLAGGTMTGDLKLNDNVDLYLGTGSDFQAYHDGSHTYLRNLNGDFIIKQDKVDADLIFQSDDGAGGTATYFYLDGSGVLTRFDKRLRMSDAVGLQLGSSGNFEMYHLSGNTTMDNFTGNLTIRNSANDKDISFACDDGSGGAAEYFRLDGGSTLTFFSKPLQMADNQKIFVGNAGDLQIYHDGTDSYINDTGTGSLIIRSADNIKLETDAAELYFQGIKDGAVKLYYDNAEKLITSSTGVTVTGQITLPEVTGRAITVGGDTTLDNADASIYLGNAPSSYGFDITYKGTGSGNTNSLDIVSTNAGSPVTGFRMLQDGSTTFASSATFSSNVNIDNDLTVSGGDISLGGTGRIQGVDTVSAGTDAANKDYVDTAVAGSGSGSVTGVSSSTTSQLTVSESSPAPALSIVTAAVTNGGTALATGDQIYDATTTRLGSYLPLTGSVYDGGTATWSNGITGNLALVSTSGTKGIIIGDEDNGAGQLFVQFNSSNGGGILNNNGGNLEITAQNYGDGSDIIFRGNDTSNNLVAYFQTVGASQKVRVVDNIKLTIGTSDDLQIYHDGSNSYISETNASSDLIIRSNHILLQSPSGENMVFCDENGSVSLYYNADKKIQTTVNGIAVPQGNSASPSISKDGDSNTGIYWGASDELNFSTAGVNRLVIDSSGLIVNGNVSLDEDVLLGSSSSIVLDDTPAASTASGSGTIVKWSVSVSTTAGNLYVIKSDGGWTTADADSEAKSTAMAAIALGGNATAGMLLQGFFYKAGHGFAIGSPLYISNTSGAFSNSRPTGTGDYVRIIGYATSANYIYFDPDKTWVKID